MVDYRLAMSESSELIQTALNEGVLSITFHRPQKKNAFTVDMYRSLVGAFERAESDKEVRVILLQGSGGSFSAGNDIGDFMNDPPKDSSHPVMQFLVAIATCKKPVVAAVEGPAVGIGTTMLLHCDLVYAATNTKFRLPFVTLGLVPEAASSYLLPRSMGPQKAAELLMFGDVFSAEKAESLGMINEVLSPEEVYARAQERAQTLSELPLGSLMETKRLLRRGSEATVKETFAEEGRLFIERLTSPEAMEAFMAFMEKRKPNFKQFS